MPSDTQENGQKESKRSEHGDEEERNDRQDSLEEKIEGSVQISIDAEISSPGRDVDMKTGENFEGSKSSKSEII